MKISAAFPSKYAKAADLDGRNVKVTIDRVEIEDIGDDKKPVVYFRGTEKGVVLNRTNSNNIADAYGDDTDGWIGQPVILYPAMVDYQGRSVEAIRIRKPTAKDMAERSHQAPPPRQNDAAFDDEAPF